MRQQETIENELKSFFNKESSSPRSLEQLEELHRDIKNTLLSMFNGLTKIETEITLSN